MNRRTALFVLVVAIPAVYFAVALAVVSTTEVLRPESRLPFALLYAGLALVAGFSDFYKLQFAQETPGPAWLDTRGFVRRAVRQHAVTVLFIALGVAACVLLDIDRPWPVMVGFVAGPLTKRGLETFVYYTSFTVSTVYEKVMYLADLLLYFGIVLVLLRGW
ncbi:MAG: hypothetical protein K2X82_02110 [Gemmataceae bacterium]|nr:hypothetical protein [Gemmataceae bacterium]